MPCPWPGCLPGRCQLHRGRRRCPRGSGHRPGHRAVRPGSRPAMPTGREPSADRRRRSVPPMGRPAQPIRQLQPGSPAVVPAQVPQHLTAVPEAQLALGALCGPHPSHLPVRTCSPQLLLWPIGVHGDRADSPVVWGLPLIAGDVRVDGDRFAGLFGRQEQQRGDQHRGATGPGPAAGGRAGPAAKKWSSWAASWRGRLGPRARGSRFGPASSSRAAASSCDRPSASTPSSPSTVSAGSVASRGSDASPRMAGGASGPGRCEPRCPWRRAGVVVDLIAGPATAGPCGRCAMVKNSTIPISRRPSRLTFAARPADDRAEGWARAWALRRKQAKDARDFTEADRIRELLRAAGWEVRDNRDGSIEVVRMRRAV